MMAHCNDINLGEMVNSIKILVVEDDPISQRVTRLMLEHHGYRVDIAQTGNIALKRFSLQQYLLIFMDMGLPDMPGTEVTQRIRYLEKQQGREPIPIIALTAHSESAKKQCLQAGMNDFMNKPLLETNLKAMLVKWLPANRN
jgi:CheY-like chemotaxis protein